VAQTQRRLSFPKHNMKVLCLHPAGSSAYEHGTQFSALALRLRTRHGIELLFVDAPLLDAATTTMKKGRGDDNYDNDNDSAIATHHRRWYVKEKDHYSGLDASLLHITQLWNTIGGIVGVLGVGQGADVAALLPLLTTNQNYSGQNNNNNDDSIDGWEKDDDDDGEEDMEEDDDEYDDNDATTRYLGYNNDNHQGRTMFPGLEFVILVNGSDILCLGGNDNNNVDGHPDAHVKIVDKCNTTVDTAAVNLVITNDDNSTSEGDNFMTNSNNNDTDEDDNDGGYYIDKDGVQSLHVIFEGINSSSDRLAQMYGPNATIHRIPSSSSSSPRSVGIVTMEQTSSSSSSSSSSSALLSNIIGRYIVSQKNIISRIIPTTSTNSSSSSTTNISRQITKLRKRLWDVEQLATIAIAEEIRCNPPKALMAVIGPAAIVSPITKEQEEKKEKVGGVVEDVIEKDMVNIEYMKTNVNAKVVVGFDEAQSSSSAEKDNINTNTLVVNKVVGAWQGGRRREFGEEGGGAPCPQEFLLREDER
jgi:hypothetical protein